MKSDWASEIRVLEGAGGLSWLRELGCLPHEPWQGDMELARQGWYVLNASGEALQAMIAPCIRRRCSFAVPGLEALGEEGARRLSRTAGRRKFRCAVLGGWRLYPLVSAVKEIVSGGCLGQVESVRVCHGGRPGWWPAVLACDLVSWLCQGHGEGHACPGEPGLSVEVRGSLGEVRGRSDWQGRGVLEEFLGGHSRRRAFERQADPRRMELGVLRGFGGLSGAVPGLISVGELKFDESAEGSREEMKFPDKSVNN